MSFSPTIAYELRLRSTPYSCVSSLVVWQNTWRVVIQCKIHVAALIVFVPNKGQSSGDMLKSIITEACIDACTTQGVPSHIQAHYFTKITSKFKHTHFLVLAYNVWILSMLHPFRSISLCRHLKHHSLLISHGGPSALQHS